MTALEDYLKALLIVLNHSLSLRAFFFLTHFIMRSIFFILASVALATSSMAKGSSTSSTITPQSKGDSTNTSTSSTMSSTSASSSTTPTPTYTPPTVSLPTVTPNPSITSSSYLDLTKKVPTILQHAIAISNVSWELGTLTEALLEVYNPSLTPFAWDPSCFNTDVPDAMIQVTLAALADYNWTGAPNTCSGHLPEYLNPDTAPVPLRQQAFVQDLALGDPNSLGTAVWVLAKLAKRDDVREQYGLRESADYAWAVGNQLEHTRQGNTSANGESDHVTRPMVPIRGRKRKRWLTTSLGQQGRSRSAKGTLSSGPIWER